MLRVKAYRRGVLEEMRKLGSDPNHKGWVECVNKCTHLCGRTFRSFRMLGSDEQQNVRLSSGNDERISFLAYN